MKNILIQLDTDAHPSAFDRVVAIDADVDQMHRRDGVGLRGRRQSAPSAAERTGADRKR